MIRKMYVATDGGSAHVSPNLIGALAATQGEHGFRVVYSHGDTIVSVSHDEYGTEFYRLVNVYEATGSMAA